MSKSIYPLYGCELEPYILGIVEDNVKYNMSLSDIFIPFITRSWSRDFSNKGPPYWPIREWELWNEIKKDDPKKNHCIGFTLMNPARSKPDRVSRPLYTKEIISYKLTLEKDRYCNVPLIIVDNYDLFVNDGDLSRIKLLLDRYVQRS